LVKGPTPPTGRCHLNLICNKIYYVCLYLVGRFEMAMPRLSKLELAIMDVLWQGGPSSIREIQEKMAGGKRPAYTTVQTMVYRLEEKGALRRARKIGNAHIFEALVSREQARRRLADEFLGLFGGVQPVMAHLVETGKLSLSDVQEAERLLRDRDKQAGLK